MSLWEASATRWALSALMMVFAAEPREYGILGKRIGDEHGQRNHTGMDFRDWKIVVVNSQGGIPG